MTFNLVAVAVAGATHTHTHNTPGVRIVLTHTHPLDSNANESSFYVQLCIFFVRVCYHVRVGGRPRKESCH